jgi:protein phosphatase
MSLDSAVVHYTVAAATDRGRKRSSNEDAFGYSAEHGVYLVCDGMGGAAAGEIASALAVDEILRHLIGRDPAKPLPQAAEEAVRAANDAVFSRSQHDAKLHGMGTTMVCLVAQEHSAWVLNIGDSRCYRLRNRSLEQLTMDHSLVDEQVRLGQMTPSDALRSPYRNVITRALGTQSLVTPDILELETEPGDIFLLCSDGLTRELPDPLIESLLSVDSPGDVSLSDLCARLVSAANKAGGEDNITCLLVRAG